MAEIRVNNGNAAVPMSGEFVDENDLPDVKSMSDRELLEEMVLTLREVIVIANNGGEQISKLLNSGGIMGMLAGMFK